MKPRTLLVLLGLALAFFAFIYFFERELPSTVERAEQDKQVLPLDPEKVDVLEVAWGGKTVRLEKETVVKIAKKDGEEGAAPAIPPEPGWKLVSPMAARADAGVVSNLVRRLAGLRKDRTFEDYDPKETGLSAPRAEATLYSGGKAYKLAFGADLPIGGAIFVGDGDKAYQVAGAADLVTELQKTPGDWRDKTLFHGERAHADKITLVEPGSKIVLVRRGEGENFDLEEPVKDAADRDLVSGLLTDLTSLQAATFLDPATPFTPAAAASRWRCRARRRPSSSSWASRCPKTRWRPRSKGSWSRSTPIGWCRSFEREVNGWRSLAWSGLQVFQVDHATFKTAAQTTEVKRVDGEWKRGEEKIDYSAASDALYPIVEVKAKEIVSRAEAASRGFALAAPRLEITLEAEKKKKRSSRSTRRTASWPRPRSKGAIRCCCCRVTKSSSSKLNRDAAHRQTRRRGPAGAPGGARRRCRGRGRRMKRCRLDPSRNVRDRDGRRAGAEPQAGGVWRSAAGP